VKGVRIVRLYREGHGDGVGRRKRNGGGLEGWGVVGMGGGGRGEVSEIVGERPPVG
jgi:hypothetical protein